MVLVIVAVAVAPAPALAAPKALSVTPHRGGVRTLFTLRVTEHCGDDPIDSGCSLVAHGPAGSACESLFNRGGFGGILEPGDVLSLGLQSKPPTHFKGDYTSLEIVDHPDRRTWCAGRYDVTLTDLEGDFASTVFCVGRRSCAPPKPCMVAGATRDLENGGVALWTRRIRPPGLYGCRPGHRPIRLQDTRGIARTIDESIAGGWVAWLYEADGGGGQVRTAKARNLKTGAVISVALNPGVPARVLLTERGELVYATSTAIGIATTTTNSVIASGSAIDAESLALGARTVYWVQDATVHSFALPAPSGPGTSG